MTAIIFRLPKDPQDLQESAAFQFGRWPAADCQALLAASDSLPGHCLEFGNDKQGGDYAVITPDIPKNILRRFVVGWMWDDRMAVTDCRTYAEEFERTVAEVATSLRNIVATRKA
jgi:hypothetical protein